MNWIYTDRLLHPNLGSFVKVFNSTAPARIGSKPFASTLNSYRSYPYLKLTPHTSISLSIQNPS